VWPWIVTLAVGIAMCAGGFSVFVGKTVVGLLDHEASSTPYARTMHLDTGTYYVFEASTSGFVAPQVTPVDVTVTALEGGTVPVFAPIGTESITSNGDVFQSVVGFTIVQAGSYRVRVVSPGGNEVPVFVAPSLATSLRASLGWLGLAGAGGALALLGCTVLIVQLVRRSRMRGPPAYAPRCANGHPAAPTDRFCAACGAPVYPAAAVVQSR
jgi:hypothetical protein